ncbi:hypothetical protein QBC36DRAFT_363690 [Triangularia setosa]|uniref:Uncharacterized protein n=1 Tax=Triangularia setosa TaxID=2587417 RepID=A0AAN6WC28_9PEZI|nr:hypothetical protein QBC36DRAFT_363690 [Podospora setosa]
MPSSGEPEQSKVRLTHVKVFYRANGSHRLEEFAQDPLPPYIDLDVSMTCTIKELSELIASHSENILPSSSVGTRLVFRSIDQSPYTLPPRAKPGTKPRFFEQPHGSYVVGQGHPGIDLPAEDENDPASTKQKLRWLDGGYIACSIFPPSDRDVSVAPALAARTGRRSGSGEGESRRSGTSSTRRGADSQPAKNITVCDRIRGEGRDDGDEDARPPRRNNARVFKGTSRGGPTSRTRDYDRQDN